jgi:3-oxoacyl-[acyl-carrier-protein] synthase-3
VVLERRPAERDPQRRRGLLSSLLKSDGTGWVHLYQPAGGSLRPPTVATVEERLHHIKMEGKETFKFAARAMADAGAEAARLAGMTLADIDVMVPHQANLRIIQNAAERMHIAPDRVIVNIDKYGNTVAASVGLALDDAYRSGRLQDGHNVLLVGFGAGLTWGGVVLRWGR